MTMAAAVGVAGISTGVLMANSQARAASMAASTAHLCWHVAAGCSSTPMCAAATALMLVVVVVAAVLGLLRADRPRSLLVCCCMRVCAAAVLLVALCCCWCCWCCCCTAAVVSMLVVQVALQPAAVLGWLVHHAVILHDDQCLLRLQLEDVLHCPCCPLHAALLQPLCQGEQHHQRPCLKEVTQADGTSQGHHHLQDSTHACMHSVRRG